LPSSWNSTNSILPHPDYIEIVTTLNEMLNTLLDETQKHIEAINNQPALAIHEIRKNTKFMRALIRLDAPSPLAQTLKMISRTIAPYRDAQVNMATYTTLTSIPNSHQYPQLFDSLTANPLFSNPQPDIRTVEKLIASMIELRDELLGFTFEPDSTTIHSVLKKSFKRGAKYMKLAQIDPTSENLHSWRKKTKRLWYQLRFLDNEANQAPAHPKSQCDRLGKMLGEIHDLDVFALLLNRGEHSNLLETVENRRSSLVDDSFESGDILYIAGRRNFGQILEAIV